MRAVSFLRNRARKKSNTFKPNLTAKPNPNSLVAAYLIAPPSSPITGRLRSQASAVLQQVEASLGADSKALEHIDEAVAALEDVAQVRSDLWSAGRRVSEWASDADLHRAVEEGMRELKCEALLARAAFLRGHIHAERGEEGLAARERAVAYRLDPSGEYGTRAHLAHGDQLTAQGDPRRALGVYRALAGRDDLLLRVQEYAVRKTLTPSRISLAGAARPRNRGEAAPRSRRARRRS